MSERLLQTNNALLRTAQYVVDTCRRIAMVDRNPEHLFWCANKPAPLALEVIAYREAYGAQVIHTAYLGAEIDGLGWIVKAEDPDAYREHLERRQGRSSALLDDPVGEAVLDAFALGYRARKTSRPRATIHIASEGFPLPSYKVDRFTPWGVSIFD